MTPDRYIDGHVQRLISELRPGDRVDLEGNFFADHDGYLRGPNASEHPAFQFEFEVVEIVDIETPECTCVCFESGYACGFPPDHWVDVDGEQVRS